MQSILSKDRNCLLIYHNCGIKFPNLCHCLPRLIALSLQHPNEKRFIHLKYKRQWKQRNCTLRLYNFVGQNNPTRQLMPAPYLSIRQLRMYFVIRPMRQPALACRTEEYLRAVDEFHPGCVRETCGGSGRRCCRIGRSLGCGSHHLCL